MAAKPIALIDLDSTMVDFHGAVMRDMKKLLYPGEVCPDTVDQIMETPYLKARYDLIQQQTDWWYKLERIEQGFKIVEILEDLEFNLHACTRGPKNYAPAWEQKARWVRDNLPNAGIIITLDKSLVYGKVLVDDWPGYILPWLEHRPHGLVVMPDHPWNKHITHPQILRCIDNYDEVRSVLKNHIIPKNLKE